MSFWSKKLDIWAEWITKGCFKENKLKYEKEINKNCVETGSILKAEEGSFSHPSWRGVLHFGKAMGRFYDSPQSIQSLSILTEIQRCTEI